VQKNRDQEPRSDAASAADLRTLEVSFKRGSAAAGYPPRDELQRLIDEDQHSDLPALHRPLGATVLDGEYVAREPGVFGLLLRCLPFRLAQAAVIVRRRHDFHVILTWAERDAVRIGLLMRFLPRRPAHVSMLYWFSQWHKALLVRLAQPGIDRMIVRAPLQYRFALDRLRLSEAKVIKAAWVVDTRFWRPSPDPGPRDTICAVGLEMRDYATLLEALRPLQVPCHIAASNRRQTLSFQPDELTPLVTVGPLPLPELRLLYARSRFVVVPLLPTDSDQGSSVILEAMAMGRAVICTDTEGQIGILEDEVNAIRVPARDPTALRTAIERLWGDPGLCDRLGAAGRELVERRHALEHFVPRLHEICVDAAMERGLLRPRPSSPNGASSRQVR
jgi:glycosyltransferase involved in cell wall biosynthesis